VPLIFKPPHWEKAVRVAAPVQHVDVVPTVLQMAGLDAGRLPGRSLLETLADPAPAPRAVHVMRARDEAIPRFPWSGRAVLQGGWKLIQDNVHQPRYELYDLTADPRERVDLWRPDGAVAPVAFRALLQALRARRPADGPRRSGVLSAEGEEQLRALGYVN
jgi:arylsulfatase A-like enzyme